MQFTTYAEASQYIQEQVKSQGQKYYCTDEYKKLFPKIKQMFQEEKSKAKNQKSRQFLDLASQAMLEVGVNYGDKVEWHNVGMLMAVEIYTGVIINKKGVPFVQLEFPINAKKSCQWHKGFSKVL